MITLARSQGHKIGATRRHELPEATLDPKGAPADHSAILTWRTNWNQSIWLNSVDATHPLLGWPLHLGETLHRRTSNEKLNSQSAVSTRLPTMQQPLEKQVTSSQELRSMHGFHQTHLHEPELFWFTSNAVLKRPISLKYWLLRPLSTRKPHAKAVPSKDYFMYMRTLIVAWRYDVPQDWLWDACHMAGVCWGSRCKWFCSKEGCRMPMALSTLWGLACLRKKIRSNMDFW